MKSPIFYTDTYKQIELRIVELLNSQPEFLTPRTAPSTRATGDAVQGILSENFQNILGNICAEYSPTFARRAMADLAFTDTAGLYYMVDVKTHRLSTHFNMPNLTSVERLGRFYEDDKNHFVVLMVKYDVEGTRVLAKQVHFVPIEFLSWDCLTIGALGWGQIQIANANVIKINERASRKEWMLQLCDIMLDFYPKEIEKIAERIEHFRQLKRQWEAKPDD